MDNEKRLSRAKETAIKSELGSLAKSSFIAGMSHRMRDPMNGLLGMLKLLIDSGLNEKQLDYAQSALDSGDKLLNLVKEITEFTYFDAEKLEIDNNRFDLFAAGKEVVKLMEHLAAAKKLKLKYQFEEGTPGSVIGDSVRIRQVLANLVYNAINFTDKGSVQVKIKCLKKDNTKADIEFSVSDTGRGLSKEKLQTVLDFTDDLNIKTHEFSKVSLELAACNYLIEAMGGKLSVESEKDQGSVFSFTIPMKLMDARIAPPGPAVEALLSKKKTSQPKLYQGIKVLVAEDDIINQSLAKAFIGKLGGTVNIAANGKKSVEMFTAGNYDIIFMDCEMPEMDGFDATREIRKMEQESGKHIPIIAMTAYATRGDQDRCKSAGMDGHTSKPVTMEALRDILEKYLIPDKLKS
jgi:CheY-like chemotaxis protein